MTDMVTKMAYAGEVPWHGKGKKLTEDMTSEQVLKEGFGWTVRTTPMQVTLPETFGGLQNVPDKFAIYREDNGEVLGDCTSLYSPFQNRELLELGDGFQQDGLARYNTAIELRGGREVIFLMKLPDDLVVNGADHYERYIMLSCGHDGKHGIHIKRTNVRVVCHNTKVAALGGPGQHFKIEHYGNLAPRIAQARTVVEIANAADKRLLQWMEQLAARKVTEKEVTLIRKTFFFGSDEEEDVPPIRRNQANSWLEIFEEESERFGQTAYSVWNAFTGLAQHKVPVRKNDTGDERMVALLDGVIGDVQAKGEKVMLDVLKLKSEGKLS